MSKPISPKQFIAENFPTESGMITRVLDVCMEWEKYHTLRTCAICGKELSTEDLLDIKPDHFLRTCNQHNKYRTCFQAEKIRELLGINLMPWQEEMP